MHACEGTHQRVVLGITYLSLLPRVGNAVKARGKRFSQDPKPKMFFARQEIITFGNLYT